MISTTTAAEQRKKVAHGASRGKQAHVYSKPRSGDRCLIGNRTGFLSLLRSLRHLHQLPWLTPWATVLRLYEAIETRFIRHHAAKISKDPTMTPWHSEKCGGRLIPTGFPAKNRFGELNMTNHHKSL